MFCHLCVVWMGRLLLGLVIKLIEFSLNDEQTKWQQNPSHICSFGHAWYTVTTRWSCVAIDDFELVDVIDQLHWSLLTLSAPALQSYVIQHTRMRQKFCFSKRPFLPWLTIVLHRIIKEILSFCRKKPRVHCNSPLIMCYPLDQNIFYFLNS